MCLGFVLLVPRPGQAQDPPLKFFKNYFVTGDYVVRGASLWRKGINGKATALIPALGGPDGVPPNADILAAFLYVQTAEKVQGSGIDRATFTGHDLGPFRKTPGSQPGSGTFAKALVKWNDASTPCWGVPAPGRKLITYRVDVLRFLPINPGTQKHDLTKKHQIIVPDAGLVFGDDEEGHTEKGSSNAPRALGASLVVIYRDAAKPFSGIVLSDGAFVKRALGPKMEQPIAGFYQASEVNPSARMTHIVGDGGPLRSERVYVGSNLIQPNGTNPFRGTAGPRWDNVTFTVPSEPLQGADEVLVTVDRFGLIPDCLSYSAIVFRTTVQDTDEDGLIDIWESSQTPLTDPNDQELPNLNAMGADPMHKDLFVEIGYMETKPTPLHPDGLTYGGILKPHHDHLPAAEALEMVAKAFKNAPLSSNPANPLDFTGINVHFDVGNHYQLPPPAAGSCVDPETWTFNCAIIPASLARGGEALNELITMCRPELLNPLKNPWVCQFSDYVVGGNRTGGFPGTVGWKAGYRFLRDRLVAAMPPSNLEECDAPGNDGPGEPCERQFDEARRHMFRYLFGAHSVGIPEAPCLKANGSANVACQKNTPAFHVPKTYSAIADFPGGDVLLTLGGFDDASGRPVGTPFQQGSTIMHEWGHNFELKHGGPANPKIGGVIVPQIPREPNCKPHYFSVMNYLYQLRGLLDADGFSQMAYAGVAIDAIVNEPNVSDGALGVAVVPELPYRAGWYAKKATSYLKDTGKPATKHCDGSELHPSEAEMVRVDAPSLVNSIDWDANGSLGAPGPLDVNFNGEIEPLNATSSDWANIRLQELASRRNVGGRYKDTLGRLAVGPMSLDVGQGDIGQGDIGQGDIGQGDIGQGDIGQGDIGQGDIGQGDIGQGDIGPVDVGQGDIGQGDIGQGDIGQGDIGQGDIGQGDIGQGDIGQGDIGQGDIGQGDIGQGDIGQGDIGRGLFGGGDLDLGGADEPVFEMDPPTAAAVEGVVEGDDPTPGPPNGLIACLTSDSDACVTHPGDADDASTPVNLSWQAPNLEPNLVVSYRVYRFDFVGAFVAPAALPTSPIATVVEGTSFSDYAAPAGAQLAYYVRAQYDKPIDAMTFNAMACAAEGGIVLFEGKLCRLESAISNFDTVTTPSAGGAGVPAQLAFIVQPSTATPGDAITPAVQVAIVDATGNIVPSATLPVTLVLGANPGEATLSGDTTQNAVNGIATFTDLSINSVASGYTLIASSSSLPDVVVTSNPFDVTTFEENQWKAATICATGESPQVVVTDASVTLGVESGDTTQPNCIHGASQLLPPLTEGNTTYRVTFTHNLYTWDSYNAGGTPGFTGTGYWDSFSVSVSTAPYKNLGLTDPVTTANLPGLGFIWGGNDHADNIKECNPTNDGSCEGMITPTEVTVDIPGNLDGNNYLNVVLDTWSQPYSNHAHPSWGTITIVNIEQVTVPAETTFSYDAVVTFASGPHAALFPAGEKVVVSYTLDPLVADSVSDPKAGVFGSGAVLSLSVSFPDIAVFAVAGPAGTAQTFNNFVDEGSGSSSDQVFFFGGPLSSASPLGEESISFIEVDFLSTFVAPPAEPLMLSSDALPLFKLPVIDAFVILGTSSGFTSVHFEPPAP